MKDIRLLVAAVVVLVAMLGYIGLVVAGHPAEAKDLLTLGGLPALTFVIGLASDLHNHSD